MGLITKSLHIGADLIAVSAILAGIRRNTGLTPNLDKLPNENAQFYAKKYLGIGESVFDYSSAYLGSSEYFKRS
ncbi:hypothetical protein ACI3LY_001944 [Candidozyma auris]|uniref:DUF1748-domain-containing protein n=1 Tax=Candidozyma auris TaxID=498019 RepID=A0A2H0ZR16_CANAR|nr:hypothetical_protein [[Candida] auris]PIS51062.1 hypothetical protein B9J08_002633 [[Candida] auris]PIS53028.1 hypothetical protein CJI97_002686 [[Candida] auris]PSK76225.1 hypothetical protein CJJ07_003950 [[Candida] auris]QEL59384.1 hypothetical protein CJJ09_001460 [[Candida] auris]QEO19698.1 hypothetical_protein [[Candida] auris]